MRGRVENVQHTMEKIDWKCMQEHLDRKAVVVMAKKTEVWLLRAIVRRTKEQL